MGRRRSRGVLPALAVDVGHQSHPIDLLFFCVVCGYYVYRTRRIARPARPPRREHQTTTSKCSTQLLYCSIDIMPTKRNLAAHLHAHFSNINFDISECLMLAPGERMKYESFYQSLQSYILHYCYCLDSCRLLAAVVNNALSLTRCLRAPQRQLLWRTNKQRGSPLLHPLEQCNEQRTPGAPLPDSRLREETCSLAPSLSLVRYVKVVRVARLIETQQVPRPDHN